MSITRRAQQVTQPPKGKAREEQNDRLDVLLRLLRDGFPIDGHPGVRRKDITFEPLSQHPFPARPSAEWNHDDVVQVLLVMLSKDYADGFISLKKLQHLAVGITTTLADRRRRDQLLGKLMRCAVAVEPKRRGRGPKGLPPSIRYIARDGVLIFADREGWAPSSPRARDALIEHLAGYGVTLTADQLDECLYRPGPRPRRHRG